MCFSLDLSCMGPFGLHGLCSYFLSHVRVACTYNFLKYFLIYCLSSSGTAIIQKLMYLTLFQRFLRLFSFILSVISLFCSTSVISTIISSSSLIHSSASIILLLVLLVYFLFQLLCCSLLTVLYFF